jgi:hypothetical protein
MRTARRTVLMAFALALVVGGGAATAWYLTRAVLRPAPGCTAAGVALAAGPAQDAVLTSEQTDNAATIAAVGIRLDMPDHAVTVALATALQESRLTDLSGGDRDSAGLFQQRPSQGWGTYAQVNDPVHASTAFYQRLHAIPGWSELTDT